MAAPDVPPGACSLEEQAPGEPCDPAFTGRAGVAFAAMPLCEDQGDFPHSFNLPVSKQTLIRGRSCLMVFIRIQGGK